MGGHSRALRTSVYPKLLALWEHGAKAQATSNVEIVTVLRREIKPMKFERFLDIVFETMCVAQSCHPRSPQRWANAHNGRMFHTSPFRAGKRSWTARDAKSTP